MVNYFLSYLDALLGLLNKELSQYLVPRAQRWKEIQAGWIDSSQQAMGIIIWILGILFAAVVVFAIINTRRENAKRKERERVYFERKAVEKELDKREIALLLEAIKQTGFSQPYRILDSFDIFQHLLNKYEEKQKFTGHEHRYFHQLVDEIKEKLGYNKIEETVQLESTREIRKGQLFKIVLKKNDKVYEYPSALVDNDDEKMVLDGSKLDLDFIPIDLNTAVMVQFYRDSDAGYNFTTTLLKPPDRENQLLYLKHPQRLNRVQARNFSRMEVKFRFSFYHIPKSRSDPIEIDRNLEYCDNLPVYVAESEDISGGGIAFYTQKKVMKGDYLYLNFQMLSEEHSEPVPAEVVWSGKNKDKNSFLVRAKYYHITDATQDALMKFVYQIQRKMARRMKFAPKR